MSNELITNHNIYGANGTKSDPREQICWDNYINSITTSGKGNAYRAAMDAGYSHFNAKNITVRDWFKARLRNLRRKNMLNKAEKVLNKTLNYVTETEKGEVRTDLLRIQADVAKHITKTLGKDEGYSERSELTGKDGKEIEVKQILTKEQIDELILRRKANNPSREV